MTLQGLKKVHWAQAIALLTMSLLILVVSVERAMAANLGNNEIQLLWGSGFKLGSAAPDDTDVLTMTINHNSTWDYGSNFFFVDLNKETNGDRETSFYSEIYPSLSLAKITGADLSLGPVTDIQPTAGLNISDTSGIYLLGVKLPLDLPGPATGSIQLYSYTTYRDPQDRDLDTTYQVTFTWFAPFTLGEDRWRFSFLGFADYIGSRGSGLTWRVVAQPQIRFDLGHLFGWTDRLLIGTELGIDRNKFGVRGVNEFVPKAMLVLKL
jgi:nucleoside-specific outer membrane channel protein Tsx